MNSLLSVVTFLPLVGTALLVLLPRDEGGQHKAVALLTTLVTFFDRPCASSNASRTTRSISCSR